MSSRESILQKVKAAQPALVPLPEQPQTASDGDTLTPFKTVLETIGGKVYFLKENETIAETLVALFPEAKRIVTPIGAVEPYFLSTYRDIKHHSLQDVDVSVIEAQFGVAENGAIWVTEQDLKIRVLPFICEHLVAVLDVKNIVPTLHEAYERLGKADYGFGVFIAGPSKTADIEQSLVLGAHGPKSMSVLLRGAQM